MRLSSFVIARLGADAIVEQPNEEQPGEERQQQQQNNQHTIPASPLLTPLPAITFGTPPYVTATTNSLPVLRHPPPINPVVVISPFASGDGSSDEGVDSEEGYYDSPTTPPQPPVAPHPQSKDSGERPRWKQVCGLLFFSMPRLLLSTTAHFVCLAGSLQTKVRLLRSDSPKQVVAFAKCAHRTEFEFLFYSGTAGIHPSAVSWHHCGLLT